MLIVFCSRKFLSNFTCGIPFMLKYLDFAFQWQLSHENRTQFVRVSFCSNTGSIRDDSYWTSRNNSLELTELSSINKVSLV